MTLYGIDIYTDVNCGAWKQLRFPKTKKRRVQNKWAKQPKNFGFEPQMYQVTVPGKPVYLIAHPALIEKLRQQLNTYRTPQ